MGRIQAKQKQALAAGKCNSFHAICKQLANRSPGTATAKVYNLQLHLCLAAVFAALKLTKNSYLHYNINIFSRKLVNQSLIGSSSLTSHVPLKVHFHNLTRNKCKGTKISIFKHFSESWMNSEKVCPNLNFTVENKMGNSDKKRMVIF